MITSTDPDHKITNRHTHAPSFISRRIAVTTRSDTTTRTD